MSKKKSKKRGEIPQAAEFGQLRAFLARARVSQAQIKDWIGQSPKGRTRGEIADLLKDRVKTVTRTERL